MCLQGIKKQITDRLDKTDLSNETNEFVDHCDYLELENLTQDTLPKGNLNLMQLNIRGLVSKQNKIYSLLNILEKYNDIHCLLLCETWLTKDTKKLLSLENHHFIGSERMSKRGVGVGFLIRDDLITRERPDLCVNTENFEHCIIELKCRKRNLTLVSLYRPPNTPIKGFLTDYSRLIKGLSQIKNCDVIIGMDHNFGLSKV